MTNTFYFDPASGHYTNGLIELQLVPKKRKDQEQEHSYVKILGGNTTGHTDSLSSSGGDVVFRVDSSGGTVDLRKLEQVETFLSEMDGNRDLSEALRLVRKAKVEITGRDDRMDALEAKRDQALENRVKRIAMNGKNSFAWR